MARDVVGRGGAVERDEETGSGLESEGEGDRAYCFGRGKNWRRPVGEERTGGGAYLDLGFGGEKTLGLVIALMGQAIICARAGYGGGALDLMEKEE